MLTYDSLKENIRRSSNILESFTFQESKVHITSTYEIHIDDEFIGSSDSLEEAREYAYNYIKLSNHIDTKTLIPEHKLVESIQSNHGLIRITDKLLESYTELLSSNEYTTDPVISELKTQNSFGKYEFTLNDGSKIAISEDTHKKLSALLQNKYDIVEYMKESVDNFKRIVREIRD